MFGNLFSQPKSRKIAIFLALLGSAIVLPFPIAGIHKFYLGQPLWGIIYLLLWHTPIPRIACAIDAVLYFVQNSEQFDDNFNGDGSSFYPSQVSACASRVYGIAQTLKELEQLKTDGLMTEEEFELKRRQLLERI